MKARRWRNQRFIDDQKRWVRGSLYPWCFKRFRHFSSGGCDASTHFGKMPLLWNFHIQLHARDNAIASASYCHKRSIFRLQYRIVRMIFVTSKLPHFQRRWLRHRPVRFRNSHWSFKSTCLIEHFIYLESLVL